MAERKKGTIHDTEWDLLEVLWAKERATAREVTEALAKKRGWAVSTVKTLLDRMVQKELVSARQVGNVWEYTPAVRPVEARRSAWGGARREGVRRRGGARAPLPRQGREALEEGSRRASGAARRKGESQ